MHPAWALSGGGAGQQNPSWSRESGRRAFIFGSSLAVGGYLLVWGARGVHPVVFTALEGVRRLNLSADSVG